MLRGVGLSLRRQKDISGTGTCQTCLSRVWALCDQATRVFFRLVMCHVLWLALYLPCRPAACLLPSFPAGTSLLIGILELGTHDSAPCSMYRSRANTYVQQPQSFRWLREAEFLLVCIWSCLPKVY